MVAQALHLHLHREGALLDHVRARWFGADLDRRLAEGADPHGDRLLKLRARRLVTPASRALVATGLERVVASVDKPKSPLSAAIPVRRRPVREARPDLLALANDLRRMAVPNPRGVAMAERLITDPGSPLYCATSSEEIQRAVRAATWNLYP
jgi:hypothetical protein